MLQLHDDRTINYQEHGNNNHEIYNFPLLELKPIIFIEKEPNGRYLI